MSAATVTSPSTTVWVWRHFGPRENKLSMALNRLGAFPQPSHNASRRISKERKKPAYHYPRRLLPTYYAMSTSYLCLTSLVNKQYWSSIPSNSIPFRHPGLKRIQSPLQDCFPASSLNSSPPPPKLRIVGCESKSHPRQPIRILFSAMSGLVWCVLVVCNRLPPSAPPSSLSLNLISSGHGFGEVKKSAIVVCICMQSKRKNVPHNDATPRSLRAPRDSSAFSAGSPRCCSLR
jgi:hypothetical protein